jgi:hypothetical protein
LHASSCPRILPALSWKPKDIMKYGRRAKLTFGANEQGAIVHISEVGSGLSCKCKCPNPECDAQLIAKKGEEKIHHFAHRNAPECVGSIESALHLAAKQLFQQESIIMLPGARVVAVAQDVYGFSHAIDRTIKSQIVTYTKVEHELMLDSIRPDIILYVGEERLLIEIAVTHKCDVAKIDKLISLNLAALEIDLSELQNEWNWETLHKAIFEDTSNRIWLNNRKANRRLNEAKQILHERLEFINNCGQHPFHCMRRKTGTCQACNSPLYEPDGP